MLFAMRLLAGLAVFRATLASPVEFMSMSYAALSTTRSIPKGIVVPDSEALIAKRAVSTTAGSGSTAPGWTFISCFTDEIDARALLTQVQIKGGPEAMSVSQCNYRCWVDGYILSGVEFAHECWCDHALNGEYHVKVPESECNMICAGDNTETCGGANRIAIYEYSITPALKTGTPIFASPTLAARSVDIKSLYTAIGCYEDSKSSRILGKYIVPSGTAQDMTVEICVTACYDSGLPYAGLEYGQECFCDTSMQNQVTTYDTDCNMVCPGDSGETCGGDLRINIYSYNVAGSLIATSTSAPPSKATSSTTITTNSPITAPGTYDFKGCYSDVTFNRTLGFVGSFPGSREGMTLEPCQGACKYAGYVFAGVEFGQECWCDNFIRGIGVSVADGECNMHCSGNNSETCGGSNRINIYSFTPATSTTATPITATTFAATSTSSPAQPSPYFESIGCYTDARSNRTLGFVGDFPGAYGNMTIEPCQWACRNAHYMFAGVEFGDECWCDNVIRGIGVRTFDSDCNMPCYGNVSEICGGSDRINIYQLMFATTTNAPPSVSATSTATPASATASPSSTSVCIEYYKVSQGDYCNSIWTSFHISHEQFTTWNPSLVFPQCQLLVGQSVCVQQGLAGSTVLTITALPPATTPSGEIPATASVSETVTMLDASTVGTPITIFEAAGPTSAVSASVVSCSIFYEVAKDDYCYEIWTGFGISQDQFTSWNPSLAFPQCQIYPGDFVCVQEGQGSTTSVASLPAVSNPTSSESDFSTSTVSTTLTSTVIAMTQAMSSSDSLIDIPFTANSVPTSTSILFTSETTSLMSSLRSGY
jgi:hypothetical protein